VWLERLRRFGAREMADIALAAYREKLDNKG
jgi:hypothetical protein